MSDASRTLVLGFKSVGPVILVGIAGIEYRFIGDYMIFFCKGQEERPIKCKIYLFTGTLSGDVMEYNEHTLQDRRPTFSVMFGNQVSDFPLRILPMPT